MKILGSSSHFKKITLVAAWNKENWKGERAKAKRPVRKQSRQSKLVVYTWVVPTERRRGGWGGERLRHIGRWMESTSEVGGKRKNASGLLPGY